MPLGHISFTARMRTSKDAFIKACSSSSYENQDEDLKVIDVSHIKSLFCNINLDETEYDPPLPRRRSKNSEFLDLDAKINESGIGEVKTLSSNEPALLDFKKFNYDNCSLSLFLKKLLCSNCKDIKLLVLFLISSNLLR